jgi:hypothetical protein
VPDSVWRSLVDTAHRLAVDSGAGATNSDSDRGAVEDDYRSDFGEVPPLAQAPVASSTRPNKRAGSPLLGLSLRRARLSRQPSNKEVLKDEQDAEVTEEIGREKSYHTTVTNNNR